MKKILIFSFLLAATSISYSALENSAVESTMNITATIIKPLTVQSNGPLEFGTLLPGVFGDARSTFTLKGEENSRVKITFENLTSSGATYSTPISLESKDSFLVNFNCTPTNDSGRYVTSSDNTRFLDEKGELILNIAASTKPRVDQTPGQYTGQIRMRATYE
ncbi:hypothetical protein [Cetobacterium somerae]|uniref:hypothetical protein n=1 Tax=Cetobacterium somerae TaxID=188913 RepID=UPI00248DB967|nr:hypothetical protein [Cetobacterium somerae]